MNILDWKNKNSWLKEIGDYAANILTPELVKEIQSSNIRGCWSDDMSWLPDEDIIYSFKSSFCGYYTHIKCFHGCRPVSVKSYYDRGFVGQSKEIVESQFRKIFGDVNVELLNKAISDLDDRGNSEKGKIYFVCTDSELINECGHYLIQGSEYIMSMATSLTIHGDTREDYRLRLRDIGVPTIFEVNMPLHNIPDLQLKSLVQVIVASWGTDNFFPEDTYNYDMGFVVHSDIEPKNIVSHSHPHRIVDPHFQRSWYYSNVTTCEMCE